MEATATVESFRSRVDSGPPAAWPVRHLPLGAMRDRVGRPAQVATPDLNRCARRRRDRSSDATDATNRTGLSQPSALAIEKGRPKPGGGQDPFLESEAYKSASAAFVRPEPGGSIRLHDCNARTCCFDGERRALTSHSVSIFGCNALTLRFAAMRGRLPPMT